MASAKGDRHVDEGRLLFETEEDKYMFLLHFLTEGGVGSLYELKKAILSSLMWSEDYGNVRIIQSILESILLKLDKNNQKTRCELEKQKETCQTIENEKKRNGKLRGIENRMKLLRRKMAKANALREMIKDETFKGAYSFLVDLCRPWVEHIPKHWRQWLIDGFRAAGEGLPQEDKESGDKYEARVFKTVSRGCEGTRYKVERNLNLSVPIAPGQKSEMDVVVVERETEKIVSVVEVKRSYVALPHGTGNLPYDLFGPDNRYKRTKRGKETYLKSNKTGSVTFVPRPLVLGVAFFLDETLSERLVRDCWAEVISSRCRKHEEDPSRDVFYFYPDGAKDLAGVRLYSDDEDIQRAIEKGERLSQEQMKHCFVKLSCTYKTADGAEVNVRPLDQLKCGPHAKNFWIPSEVAAVESDEVVDIGSKVDGASSADDGDEIESVMNRAMRNAGFVRRPLDIPDTALDRIRWVYFCKIVVNSIAGKSAICEAIKEEQARRKAL